MARVIARIRIRFIIFIFMTRVRIIFIIAIMAVARARIRARIRAGVRDRPSVPRARREAECRAPEPRKSYDPVVESADAF